MVHAEFHQRLAPQIPRPLHDAAGGRSILRGGVRPASATVEVDLQVLREKKAAAARSAGAL